MSSLNVPGGSFWAEALRSLRQYFHWHLNPSRGPQWVASFFFFALKSIYSLAIFSSLHLKLLMGKEIVINQRYTDFNNSLSGIVILCLRTRLEGVFPCSVVSLFFADHYPNFRLSKRIILNFVWGWILSYSKVSYEKLGVFFLFLLWNILPQPQTLVNVYRDLMSRGSGKCGKKNKLRGLHSFSRKEFSL